jgi:ribonuclease Z
MDHAAGIAYYLSQRNFCGLSAGTVLAPPNLLPPIQTILDGWKRLDGNNIPAKLVGVKSGDEYQIKRDLYVRVFPTKHSRGSVGFSMIEKRKKLKAQYAEMTGEQLVALKKKGVEIEYVLEVPIVTYLGDTKYVDFAQLEYIAKSKILIAECTFFLAEHTGRAEAGRHMHIEEFAGLLSRMENKHIIVTHLSQRTGIPEVRRILKKTLPASTYKKVIVLMDRKPKRPR